VLARNGRTLEELLDATKGSRRFLVDVLNEEVALGRVRRENGCYELIRERFEPGVLEALAELQPIDPDDSQPYRARLRIDAPSAGALARAFS
jgi:hypothetical protein